MNSWLCIQSETKTTTQKTTLDIQQELDCLQFRHLDLRRTPYQGNPCPVFNKAQIDTYH